MADISSSADLPPGVHFTRPPAWLLPDLSDEHRNRLRPDALIIDGHDTNGNLMPSTPSSDRCLPEAPSQRKATILEIGYCSDRLHGAKFAIKQHQHAELKRLLTAAGWQVETCVITLGHAGTISLNAAANIAKAGAAADAVQTCCRKLSRHAVVCLDNISRLRHGLTVARSKPP